MTSADSQSIPSQPQGEQPAGTAAAAPQTPHNFEVQKEEHRRIRNDPDYDDWEYGTEPLPHEAWVPGQRPEGSAAGDA